MEPLQWPPVYGTVGSFLPLSENNLSNFSNDFSYVELTQ